LRELVLEPKEEWEWLEGEEWYVDRDGGWVGGEMGMGVDVGEFEIVSFASLRLEPRTRLRPLLTLFLSLLSLFFFPLSFHIVLS